MQMLKKIFNSKDKYYLELDEALESKPVQQVVETAKKAVNVAQDKAAEALESKPVQQVIDTAKQAADATQDKLQSVVETDVKSEVKTEAKAVKKTAKSVKEEAAKSAKKAAKAVKEDTDKSEKKSEKKPEAQAQPSPKDAGASSFDPPFWVAAMYKNNGTSVNGSGSQAEQTFATDNLMPAMTKYRRRPGPSLNKFKDMAKKAKTPKG